MFSSKSRCALASSIILFVTLACSWRIAAVRRVHVLNTLISAAVQDNNVPEVAALLREGADPDARTPVEQPGSLWSRLLELIPGHRDQSHKGMTLLCASLDVALGDEPDRTEDLPLLLLAHGANPNQRDDYGEPTLQRATYWRFEKTVAVLLDHGADVNERNPKGWTALYAASRYGEVGIVLLLLRRGADPNISTNGGDTPLKVALVNGGSPEGKRILAALRSAHARG